MICPYKFCSVFLTLLHTELAHQDLGSLKSLEQFLQGMVNSPNQPCDTILCSRWAPVNEKEAITQTLLIV